MLSNPIDAVVFDCDGTLTSIEGIDRLAEYNGVGELVSKMTADAMSKTGLNPLLYETRLNLVKPTAKQLKRLAEDYFEHRTPDIISVIQTLQKLNKAIYVISGGLTPAVLPFAQQLGVHPARVFAVNITFDQCGVYQDFDRTSPLIHGDGKRVILEKIKQIHPRVVFAGDGLNDFAAQDMVTRFVGYGGAYYRENIQKRCEFYITSKSMNPLLDFCLTQNEIH